MEAVDGTRPAHQGLEKDVHAGDRLQVLTPYDVGDVIQGVIMAAGEMVTRRRVLSGKNNIAELFRTGAHATRPFPGPFGIGKLVIGRAEGPPGLLQGEAPGEGRAAGQPLGLFLRWQRPADETAFVRICPCGQAGGNLAPGEKAAIDKAPRAKGIECPLIIAQMVRLAAKVSGPFQTQPGKVFEDGGFEGRTTAGLVNVLDPQAHRPAS